MRRQGRFHCARDILSPLQLFPVDYFGRSYCVFEEDAIMTQQTTPRTKSVVATTTACAILVILCCNLPQANSLGSECYTITGLDYRGTEDKIGLPPEAGGIELQKYNTTCLLWNTSVESKKPQARERGIGNHNFCRNPDKDILPWCKIAGVPGRPADGAWGYCHLPTCQVPGYLGCFPDQGSPSALDGMTILHKDMTVGACIDFCRRNGYEYAGLEAGNACFCGNDGYDRYGSSSHRGTHCSLKCFGNRGQPCGGDGYLDVYRADIGSCGTGESPLRKQAGAIYSPGYPDYPASPAMMTSLGATENMIRKHRDFLSEQDLDVSGIQKIINESPKKPDDTCEWKVDIHQANEIRLLIRKIDPKRKLGGIIEIKASDGAQVVVATSENSNVTSQVVWITQSEESRHDVDVIVPDGNTENDNTGSDTNTKKTTPRWSAELARGHWPHFVLPSSSLESKVSISGGAFTVRLIRVPEIMSALKSTYEFQKRSKNRRKLAAAEWSRFVVEYEASFPNGVTYDPNYAVKEGAVKKESSNNSRRNNHNKKPKKHWQTKESSKETMRTITSDMLEKTKFSISPEDAIAIQKAVSASAGENSDSTKSDSGNSPIKIEVFVEPIPGDSQGDRKTDASQEMSKFTVPLLLAVLLTTTAILILFAILVIFRRGGLSNKKSTEKAPPQEYSRGLIVACPPDESDREKSGSNSNLSSSSTADSVLLTDSEVSEYSKASRKTPVTSDTIKDLMEFLRNQPGLIQSHPLADADQYRQISQNHHLHSVPEHGRGDSRHDDVTPLPGPCPHCCGCSEDNRAHRHGDSCRTHHNLGKHGRPQAGSSARSGGGKNPRGLSIRANKSGASAQPSLAPPLSPIREVSSVTSSMMSLPITSANSQTSLIKQASKSSPNKAPKKDMSEVGPESEILLSQDSDAPPGVGDSLQPNSELMPGSRKGAIKLSKSHPGKKGELSVSGRYLGGISGACYDSGYATSNYEEDEEKAIGDVIIKKSKNFASEERDPQVVINS